MSVISEYFKKSHHNASYAGRPLHCIFYSHVWNIYELENLGLVNPKQDILLELATESQFALMFNSQTRDYDTLLDLLQPDIHLDDLIEKFKGIHTPIVLAPNTGVSVNRLLSALALVASDACPVKKAVVLVHYRDAEKFRDAYAQMSQFSILWDVADYPNATLQSVAEILVSEGCLEDTQRWQGFHLCSHVQRHLPDTEQRQTTLNQLLDEFPLLKSVSN